MAVLGVLQELTVPGEEVRPAPASAVVQDTGIQEEAQMKKEF